MSSNTYTNLLTDAGLGAAGFVGNSMAARSNSLMQSQMTVAAALGTPAFQVEVPGMPGLFYAQVGDPGCRPKNFILVDGSQNYKNYPPGTKLPLKFPPGPGPSPTPMPYPKPYDPKKQPYTPPVQPPPAGGWPYFPAPLPDDKKNGRKLIDNCPIFDTGPSYGDFDGGGDITTAILACASAPCGYVVYRATVKYIYDSFVKDDINLNPFDTGSSQDGQGDADHFLKFTDAKGRVTYAALQLKQGRAYPLMVSYLQGTGSVILDLYADTSTTTPGPITFATKGNDLPIPWNGHHGRCALYLTAIEYQVPNQWYNGAVTPPLKFDFSTIPHSTQGWEGGGAYWYSDWGGVMASSHAQYKHPIYISGGSVVTVVDSRIIFGTPGNAWFGCATGGTPNVELISSVGSDASPWFRNTQTWRIGEGLYFFGVQGTIPDFHKIELK